MYANNDELNKNSERYARQAGQSEEDLVRYRQSLENNRNLKDPKPFHEVMKALHESQRKFIPTKDDGLEETE